MPAKKKTAQKPVKKAAKKKVAKRRIKKVGDQLWVTNTKKLAYVVVRPRTALEAIRMVEAMDSKKINPKNRKALYAGLTAAVGQYYRVVRKLGIGDIHWGGISTEAGPVISVRSLVVAGLRHAQKQLPL